MTIKEILSNDKSLLSYLIEVNGEKYDYHKHDSLIHIDTEIETYEEYDNALNTTLYRSKIKFIAIEKEEILKLLFLKKDADNSLSDFMDKRIKEIAKE